MPIVPVRREWERQPYGWVRAAENLNHTFSFSSSSPLVSAAGAVLGNKFAVWNGYNPVVKRGLRGLESSGSGGNSDRVEFTGTENFPYGNAFTVWWYGTINAASSASYDTIFSNFGDAAGSSANAFSFGLVGPPDPNHDQLYFEVFDNSNVQTFSPAGSLVPISSTVPTFVVGTLDGATLRLYVDGVQVSSTACTATLQPRAQPLRIGARSNSGAFYVGAAQTCFGAGILKGALPAGFIEKAARNPWQLFA